MAEEKNLKSLISNALEEDLGERGDITAQYFISPEMVSYATIRAKETGVLAGIEVARECFLQFEESLEIKEEKVNGDVIEKGTEILKIRGKTRAILGAERTALNFLQRLSGIASLTRQYVDAAQDGNPKCKILDTRKTTPGWRFLEKGAVKAGGGMNHRMGLYDMVMVKDNHLMACGDFLKLQEVILKIKGERPEVDVVLEADTLEQVAAFLELKGVDIILLDNMPLDSLFKSISLRREKGREKIQFEASGGISLENVPEIAKTGVERISIGALTHSAPSLDLSLDFD